MRQKIFVNYRRDDDPGFAARVRDALVQRFGDGSVFMDVDNLLAGQKFESELAKALDTCDVLIAILGSHWIDLTKDRSAQGERDFACEEIAAALKQEIVVIPVRVGREGKLAPLPRPQDLPTDIRNLVAHQKHDIAHEHFGQNIAALAHAIETLRRPDRIRSAIHRTAILAGILILVGSAYGAMRLLDLHVPWWSVASTITIAQTEPDKRRAERAESEAKEHREAEVRRQAEAEAASLDAQAKADAEAKRRLDAEATTAAQRLSAEREMRAKAEAERQMELEYWRAIQGTRSPSQLRDYLQRYPNGSFASIARNWLQESMSPPPQPATLEPPPPLPSPSYSFQGTLIEMLASGRWATGGRSNCGIARKTYSLSVEGQNIVWRDDIGNVDIETVTYISSNGFATQTLRSIHVNGINVPAGQGWDYSIVGPGQVQVRQQGRSSFQLFKC